MIFIETKTALNDKKKIKSMAKSIQLKLLDMVTDIVSSPRSTESKGSPEQLKYSNIELWSRELTKKDRIVYGIHPGTEFNMPNEPEVIVFYQYLGHYSDK